jgi:hypothetical protein
MCLSILIYRLVAKQGLEINETIAVAIIGCEISEYTTTVSEQRLGKHVPGETNTPTKLDLLLETGYLLCGSCGGIMSRAV